MGSFSSGALAARGLCEYAPRKACELNQVVLANAASIDDTLAALISPEAATSEIEQLVQDHGYPDVDLARIDLDWL